MNNIFENDELLKQLSKSQVKLSAPMLSEDLITNAIARPNTYTRRRTALVLSSSVAALALIIASAISFHQSSTIKIVSAQSARFESAQGPESYANQIMGPFVPAFDFEISKNFDQATQTASIYRAVNNDDRLYLLHKLASYFNVPGAEFINNSDTQSLTAIGKKLDGQIDVPAANKPYVQVANSGSLYFEYVDSSATGSGECLSWSNAKVPVDEYGSETDTSNSSTRYCRSFAGLDNYPTIDDATEQAVRLFNEFGLSVTKDEIVFDDRARQFDGLIGATVHLRSEGKETPITWQISWGNTGRIQSFAGYDVSFDKAADAITISKAQAAQTWQTSSLFFTPSVAVNPELQANLWSLKWRTDKNCANSSVGKPCIFNVDKATLSVGAISDDADQLWLVPTYTFSGSFGIAGSIPALSNDFIQPSQWGGYFQSRYPDLAAVVF